MPRIFLESLSFLTRKLMATIFPLIMIYNINEKKKSVFIIFIYDYAKFKITTET